MKGQIYNGKNVIWESKTKQIFLVFISFLFVSAAIWTKDKSSIVMFWMSIILFGVGGFFLLIRLLNPKNLFVTHNSTIGKEIMALHNVQDIDFFTYNYDGFIIRDYSDAVSYKWSSLETIFGYKNDQYVIDEICLHFFTSDKLVLGLSESTLGWYQFNIRLLENIPEIPNNWESEIAVPAFETNLTLLYDKKGRTKEQAEAECYKN